MQLNEVAVGKVESLANQALDHPLSPANYAIDKLESPLNDTPRGRSFLKRVYRDPTTLSKTQNAKEWAGLMAAGSLASHAPALAAGDISTPAIAALATGNAAKGALIGPLLSGGKDTLFKSAAIPAGIMAITTPLMNSVGEDLAGTKEIESNYADELDWKPEARVGLTAALGGGLWTHRNRKKQDRYYI